MTGFEVGRWRARWIWAPGGGGGRTFVALRRDVGAAAGPARLRVCADSRYVLWVNGAEVSRGPVRINPRRRRYDVVDVELREGRNTLAALVCFYGNPTAWWMPAPTLTSPIDHGGFVLESEDGAIVTDASWSALRLDGWTAMPPGGGVSGRGEDVFDMRSLAPGWEVDTDLGWGSAVAFSGSSLGECGRPEPPNFPHGPYGGHPLPRPPAVDVPLVAGSVEGVWVADRVISGTVVIDAEGPAGRSLSITTSEFVDDQGRLAGDAEMMGIRFILDGSRRTCATFDTYGLRGLSVAGDGVAVHSVHVVERLFPVAGPGSFACSDPLLDRIWAIGRRTVSLCSADAYLDCPTREQRAWTGDAVIHQMVDLTTNDHWELARWNVTAGASPRADGMLPMAVAGDAETSDIAVIPDWALHWIHAVHNLYLYVGDAEEIRRLLPVVEGVLGWFEPFVDGDGLLRDVPSWVIIDWASVYTEGVCAPLNGLWGRALREFAEMAAWVGDGGRAAWATAVHRRLSAGFERLWDGDHEWYVDSSARPPMASQQGQAAAIVGGLAPPSRWPRLVSLLTDPTLTVHATFGLPDGPPDPEHPVAPGGPYMRGPGHPEPWWDTSALVVRAQPFFRYVVHDAVVAAGRPDLVAGLCREWEELFRFADTSWSETWFGGTVSHGWSSTPTRDLMQRVLGVTPAAPGFAVASVAPALGSLAWARGVVPTGHGPLSVSATPDRVEVDSPIPFVVDGVAYKPGSHTIERRSS